MWLPDLTLPTHTGGGKGGDKDPTSAQESSLSRQFAQRWNLRALAQVAALKEMASSKLRRLLVLNRLFNCTDVKVRDAMLIYKAVNRKGAPRGVAWRRFRISAQTGATAKFRRQTLEVARFRVRRQVDPKGAGEANWNPASENLGALHNMPSVETGKTIGGDRSVLNRRGGPSAPSAISPREQSIRGPPPRRAYVVIRDPRIPLRGLLGYPRLPLYPVRCSRLPC